MKKIKCRDCKYWSGAIGSHNEWVRQRRSPIKLNPGATILCAVQVCPQPSIAALEFVDGRLADALHECRDFVEAHQ